MREILFIVATWSAAAGLLLSAIANHSPVLWFWAAYTSSLAFLAVVHARMRRWGSIGSLLLTFGILLLLARVLYLQIADRNYRLIPANWMAGFYLASIGITILCLILVIAIVYWLASSCCARQATPNYQRWRTRPYTEPFSKGSSLKAVALVLVSLYSIPSRGETAMLPQTLEVLVSDRAEEVSKGEALLAANEPLFVDTLLERIRRGDTDAKGKAAAELGILISPWIRGKEAGARSWEFTSFEAPRRPVEKMPQVARGIEIRQAIQAAISTLIQSAEAGLPQSPHFSDALNALCETLGEVADDATMDWAIERLQQINSSGLAPPLMELGASYLGIPTTFRAKGICGNSSRAEVEMLMHADALAFSEARANLKTQWSVLRGLKAEERIAFAIKSWRDQLLLQQKSYDSPYAHQRWLFLGMESLIRLGTPAVDSLRRQQALEENSEMKAVWEAVIATITGQEDAEFVRTLFHGSDVQRKLACEIVVGATSRNWLHELDEVMQGTGSQVELATKAIASCDREEGLSALRAEFERHPSNFHAGYAVKELETRAVRGSPHHLRRYYFP